MSKKAKVKTIPEIWQAFARETIKLDKASDKPNGYYWLCAIHRLEGIFPKIHRTYIVREHLTDGTQGEIESIPQTFSKGDGFYDVIQKLIKDLGNPKKITRIDFSGLKFKKSDNFLNFIFPVDVSFARTTFSGIANFCHTDFQAADFSKAVFLDYANFYSNDFDSTVFNGVANFDKVIFSNCADFDNAGFRKEAIFTNTKFYQKKSHITYFNKAKFSKKVLFTDAKFHCKMCFTDVKFAENTFFENAVFFKNSYFTESKFSKTASFKSTTFSENVYFDYVVFFETINFKNAVFCGETAKFRNADFKKIADFSSTTFKGYANFKDSTFGGRTSFQKTIFKYHAPRFYGAEFNNEMTFFGMIPPKFEKNKEEGKTDYKKRIGENQNSYENTAILLEEKKKYHDQHFFFRQEMTCRRRIERRAAIRWAFWLYEKLANYGYGIDRALFWWATHIVLGVLVIATIYGDMSFQKNLPCAISVSFANANPYAFFGFDSVQLAECYDMFNMHAPILFAIIKVIQTIVGVGLLFLVLLTLRVRFRLNN